MRESIDTEPAQRLIIGNDCVYRSPVARINLGDVVEGVSCEPMVSVHCRQMTANCRTGHL